MAAKGETGGRCGRVDEGSEPVGGKPTGSPARNALGLLSLWSLPIGGTTFSPSEGVLENAVSGA
jgi:hypothetical protein